MSKGSWIFKNGKYRCSVCGAKAPYHDEWFPIITHVATLTPTCQSCAKEEEERKLFEELKSKYEGVI